MKFKTERETLMVPHDEVMWNWCCTSYSKEKSIDSIDSIPYSACVRDCNKGSINKLMHCLV